MMTSSYSGKIEFVSTEFSFNCTSATVRGVVMLYDINRTEKQNDFVNPKIRRRLLIGTNSLICGGDPVLLGTRISVANIIEKRNLGYDIDQILEDYPHLSRDQVIACFEYYEENKKDIQQILEEEKEVNES